MDQEAPFYLPLFGGGGDGEEVEVVGIFENLFGKVGARRRQRPLEVGDRLPFPLVQLAFYLQGENIPAPAELDRRPQVPFPQLPVFNLVQQYPEMAPRQKCHKLWHYLGVRPGLSQSAHILQVARTEDLDAGKLTLKIMSQTIDHLGAPAFSSLSGEDLAADRPVVLFSELFGAKFQRYLA